MKILITGKNGLLGNTFLNSELVTKFNCTFTDKQDLDISNSKVCEDYFTLNKFDLIINCAGIVGFNICEQKPDLAFSVNHKAIINLINYCQRSNCKLIHFSTDYVFDGNKKNPYSESDNTNPISLYGKSKLAGENEILKSRIGSLIFRSSWIYSKFGVDFIDKVTDNSKHKDEISVVFDQVGSPTCSDSIVNATIHVIEKHLNLIDSPNLYHIADKGSISWFNYAKIIVNLLDLNLKVKPIKSESFELGTLRPTYSVLNSSKFENDFGFKFPDFESLIYKFLKN